MRRRRLVWICLASSLLLGADPAETPAPDAPAAPVEPAAPSAKDGSETPAEPASSEAAAPTDAASVARESLELEARQEALRRLEADVARTLDELAQLRADLDEVPEEPETRAELERLVSFYQAMKPTGAARLLEKLPLEMSADVLGAMSPRTAGKILNAMQEDRAVLISRHMAGRER